MNIAIGSDLALAFGLLFTRAAAMILVLPQVLGVSVPITVKLLLAMLLAGALMPLATLSSPPNGDLLAVMILVAREAVVGVILSFAAAVVVGAVTMVGELLGTAMEINSGAILRGTIEMPNVLADGLATLSGLLFFVAGFHRALLLGLAQSLKAAPLGALELPELGALIAMGGRVFQIALEIGLPVLIPLFVLALTQGVIARLAPQINVLIAAPAAVILAGLALLGLNALGLGQAIVHAWAIVIPQAMGWFHA